MQTICRWVHNVLQVNDRLRMARTSLRAAVLRGSAAFLAGFSLWNWIRERRNPGFDANEWWILVPGAPLLWADLGMLIASVLLAGFAVWPRSGRIRRTLTLAFTGLLLLCTLWNGIQFYSLQFSGAIRAGLPMPLSFLFSLLLFLVVWELARSKPAKFKRCEAIMSAGVALAWLGLFPLLQMLFFGYTDYRRRADVVVVLGARVYADGQLSDALADRVRTGCELYRQGLARKVIFSGGPGDGAIHETEAMRSAALKLGVAAEDILLDREGLNTRKTVENTGLIFAQQRWRRVLVVSHFYHLPRVKLDYRRAGWEVYTVPARESYLLRQMPWFMAREVAAWWAYYFRSPSGEAGRRA
jgi:uncharacterized SAM-binding protein YcdF (DUF218 family)